LGSAAVLDKGAGDHNREEVSMAVEGNRQDDMQAHVKSYSSFAWMMKWGAIVCVILALIVVFLISN
jgi:hypothetical protein